MATPSHPFQSGKPAEKILFALVLVWIVLVFFHYFSLPATINLSFLATVFAGLGQTQDTKLWANGIESLKILILFLLIGFTLWRVGRKLLRWLGLELENISLRFSMEMAMGILFFNNLWLGLGLNRLWFNGLLIPLALAFLAFSLWDFLRTYLRFQKFPKFEWPGWVFASLGCAGAPFLALSFAQGLAPEVYYDALVYHLGVLSFWKYHHGLSNFYTNFFSYYPFGAELYFFNGFFLQGGETAKLLNALTSGLCGLAAAGWVWEEAGITYGLLAWAMVMSLPLVSASVWTTQNDVVLAYFLVLFFYTLARWAREKPSWRWATVAGILGGGALTVKYTAIIPVAAGILALGLTQRDTWRVRHWPQWGILKGLIFLGVLPWLLKNAVFTGNPFYPYLSSWMGGQALPVENMNALLVADESPLTGNFSLMGWLGRIFSKGLDKAIAPLLFSFIPFFFLSAKYRSATKYLLVLSTLSLVSGFLISNQLRLMIPAFIICFVLMTMVLADLQKVKWARIWAWVALAFSLFSFLSLCRLSVNYYHAYKVWLGAESRQEYLASEPQTRSYYGLTQASGALLPHSDQILVIGDARSLYYTRPFYANSVFDPQVLELMARREKDGEGIWKALREMGVDDLVVSGEEGLRMAGQYRLYTLQPEGWKKLEDFIQIRTDLIYQSGPSGIYCLRATPASERKPIPNPLALLRTPDESQP